MVLSPEIITNIAFGLVMVVIGIGGIWIAKWSTNRTADAARRQVSDLESLILETARTRHQDSQVEEVMGHGETPVLPLNPSRTKPLETTDTLDTTIGN